MQYPCYARFICRTLVLCVHNPHTLHGSISKKIQIQHWTMTAHGFSPRFAPLSGEDPGFSHWWGGGGADPAGEHYSLTWLLCGKNVCNNERIGSRWEEGGDESRWRLRPWIRQWLWYDFVLYTKSHLRWPQAASVFSSRCAVFPAHGKYSKIVSRRFIRKLMVTTKENTLTSGFFFQRNIGWQQYSWRENKKWRCPYCDIIAVCMCRFVMIRFDYCET